MGVEVILNFLKYIAMHDVCPEFADDIRDAEAICRRATEEMPAIGGLLSILPGDFNTAATALSAPASELFEGMSGMPDQTANTIFGVNIAILFPSYTKSLAKLELVVTSTIEQDFEVCQISLATEEARKKYQASLFFKPNSIHMNVQAGQTNWATPREEIRLILGIEHQ